MAQRTGQRTGRDWPVWLRRALSTFVAMALLVYPLDWAAWRVRSALGGGMGQVTVTSTQAATMKGNRYEVFSQDTTAVPCSRSLLPEAGAGACWWLRGHPRVLVQQ